MDGLDATMMAWIKLDPTFSSNGDVAGQGIMRMYVNGTTKKLHSYYITSSSNSAYGSSSVSTLDTDQWYHVAISYEGATGMTKIYVNGELERSGSIPAGTLSTNPTYAGPDFNIGRHSRLDNSYFKGAVDEVRVFDTVLTDRSVTTNGLSGDREQNGQCDGSVIDKGIMDIASDSNCSMGQLTGLLPYDQYPYMERPLMLQVITGCHTKEYLHVVQPQTAPMPYRDNDGWSLDHIWHLAAW